MSSARGMLRSGSEAGDSDEVSSSFPGGRFRDERRVRERLQTLSQMRYVRAFPASQGVGGPINWYKLTAEGYRVLHGPDVALPHRSRFEATSPSRFHHTQTLAEVIIHVLTAAHNGRIAVMRFFGDVELTVEGAGRKLHPDCFFQLSHAGRQFNVMFEIDHATESLDSTAANAVREKLLIYEAHQDMGRLRHVHLELAGESGRTARSPCQDICIEHAAHQADRGRTCSIASWRAASASSAVTWPSLACRWVAARVLRLFCYRLVASMT